MPAPVGNFIIKALINSPWHPLLGESFAFITLTGRTTANSIQRYQHRAHRHF
jgi:hypothetical protein